MDTAELRRVREFVAWLLLAAAAVLVVIGAWQFLGLPGSSLGTFSSGGPSSIALRGSAALSSLASIDLTLLPVAAVLLAALAGRPVPTARRLALVAVAVQVIALGLATVGWLVALRSFGAWFPLTGAVALIVAGAGLTLSVAVLRSPALRIAG
jgi:hypothetical protein